MIPRFFPIRVLIADDDRGVRCGIRRQLRAARGIRVIGEVANGIDAVNVARNERAQVVLLAMKLSGISGAEVTRELTRSRSTHPVAVIVMTGFEDGDRVAEALDAGAVGCLLKDHDSELLVDAIRAAARGEVVASSQDAATLLREYARRRARIDWLDATASLTTAERRVIALLAAGVTTNDALADRLEVSVHTVRSHVHAAMRKAGMVDRTQLALWGRRHRPTLDPSHSNE